MIKLNKIYFISLGSYKTKFSGKEYSVNRRIVKSTRYNDIGDGFSSDINHRKISKKLQLFLKKYDGKSFVQYKTVYIF